MKNTFILELTAKEIEALQIAISAERLTLETEAEHLENHNLTGINTKIINLKRERMNDLDKLFDKLYDAEQGGTQNPGNIGRNEL